MTPEELEKQRQEEDNKKKAYKRKLALQAGLAIGIGVVSKLPAVDKLNKSVAEKVESLKARFLELILPLADKLGIEGIETGNPKLPDLCPSPSVIKQAKSIRDALGDDIQNVLKYLEIISGALNILSQLINGKVNSVTALNALKTASALAAKLVPSPPGVPGILTSTLSDLDDLRTLITFTQEGEPKLPKDIRSLENGINFLSLAIRSLLKVVQILAFIDQILNKCGEKVNPIESDLFASAEQTQDGLLETYYKGFIFEIVEEPFNATLNQKVAVAKNSQGIVLLKSEPSFTDNPQILINELKLVIDRDNLKAD